jgi:DNA-binding winged helix-turn-helix (wHTH) protein
MSSTSPESSSRFTVGHWAADQSVDELRADGRIVKLEPRTMRLLSVLAQTPGELVGTDQLMDTVWPGVIVTPGSLYEAVAQLRKVLGPDHIDTVPRKGYRLVAPVVREPLPVTGQVRPAEPVTPSLGPRSVAVLPFRTRGLPDSHAFVSETLADDLIADLSRQPGLVVIARGTMLGYVGLALPPKEISRQLGVRYVVDGLLEVRGPALHATVQLVDTDGPNPASNERART